jgi:adenylate kinase family enzyme
VFKKISVIGNSCGGKTKLSRKLAARYQIPLTHVDAIQFLPGMKIRPHSESIELLRDIQRQDSWLIDGFGPLDIIEERFQESDIIVFIDLPLWRHIWWGLKRQVINVWSPRSELPAGCNEVSPKHTLKLFKTMWKTHHGMRPELLRILAREALSNKVRPIRSLAEWKAAFKKGL